MSHHEKKLGAQYDYGRAIDDVNESLDRTEADVFDFERATLSELREIKQLLEQIAENTKSKVYTVDTDPVKKALQEFERQSRALSGRSSVQDEFPDEGWRNASWGDR